MPTILQISAGQGPAECRKFVPLLAEIVRAEAVRAGLACLPLAESEGVREAASLRFAVSGGGLTAFREAWEGTVRWIWRSTIRPNWPRKNWFVKVTFFDFAPEKTGAVAAVDLKIETCRASGPGGQHVNTSDTAVRITHLPSGVSAVASEERSQTRNRELALLRVQEKLHLVAEAQHASEKAAMRLDHYRLERGGAVRTFRGLPPEEVR